MIGRSGLRAPRGLAGIELRLFALAVAAEERVMARRLHLVLRSDASLAKKLRNAVRAWLARAGINGGASTEITYAVNEAFVNAVEHPRDRATDQVDVEGVVSSSDVVVRVRDDGTWNEDLDPDRRHFGLGVVMALMDSIEIERGASGSIVTLRRTLSRKPRKPD